MLKKTVLLCFSAESVNCQFNSYHGSDFAYAEKRGASLPPLQVQQKCHPSDEGSLFLPGNCCLCAMCLPSDLSPTASPVCRQEHNYAISNAPPLLLPSPPTASPSLSVQKTWVSVVRWHCGWRCGWRCGWSCGCGVAGVVIGVVVLRFGVVVHVMVDVVVDVAVDVAVGVAVGVVVGIMVDDVVDPSCS